MCEDRGCDSTEAHPHHPRPPYHCHSFRLYQPLTITPKFECMKPNTDTHTRLRADPYGPQERIKGQRMVKSFLRLLRQGFSRFVFSLILPKLRSWLIPRPLVFTANRGKKLKNSPWRFIPFEKRSLITYFICKGGCFACLEQYYFHIFHIMRRCVWLLFHVTSW